ncbi:MAG: endonuclease III [Omnitrophica WOR_2 bacterium SM23_72]|nr:MAG: endonuclease III [Omnitrophica WOR_2 bacterium SM23_72]
MQKKFKKLNDLSARDRRVKILLSIAKQVKGFTVPIVSKVSEERFNPYRVLISCILSLRTKDQTTAQATHRLFKVADNPVDMVKLSPKRIQRLIYPVGFYRNKSRVLIEVSRKIIQDFAGRVPGRLEDLLTLKGVGRKTANLVLGLGFGTPAICVDTHVHRISNRLGWVKTRSPEETERALEKIIPKRRWVDLNTWLVAFGQNICVPISPFCSRCRVSSLCQRTHVKKFR